VILLVVDVIFIGGRGKGVHWNVCSVAKEKLFWRKCGKFDLRMK
jgi:hypothetical protein